MANLIQVKRSTTNATPASLSAGELAYSFLNTSNSLFVGNTSAGGPIRIGGGNYIYLHQSNTSQPGALTANAVVIVNGNSFVTNWKTNALTVGIDGATVSISNISTFANSTQLGTSAGGANTELVSSWAIKTYIDNNSPRLPNTYVAFGANSVANGGSAAFTFDSASSTLAIGNSSVNTTVNSISVTTGTVNASNVSSAGDLVFLSGGGSAGMQFKASGVIELATAGLIVGGPYGGSKLELSTGVTSLRAVRDGNITLQVGTNDAVTSTWTFSNTGNFSAPGNATVTGVTNAASFNSTGTATSTFANNVTVTGTANVSSGINVGANVVVTTSTISVGNSTVNTQIAAGNVFLNGSTLIVGNTTTNTTITGTSATFNGTLSLAGTLAAGNTTVTGFVNASSYGTFGGVVNATSFNSTGTATSTFANNVTINGTTNTVMLNVTGDTTIGGNLYVTGNLVSINVSTLSITDSLIQLATNNTVTPDILDIGLSGSYGVDANTNNHRHTGLFRDASDAKWKLFDNLLTAPTTTVDTTNATFNFATLQAHLTAGGATATGFIANATTVAITANSTLNVAIVANTLSLSTALPGTSGGTGLSTFTTEDILVANATNGFRKLNVGSEGYVLQVSSGVVTWNTLDGGSF